MSRGLKTFEKAGFSHLLLGRAPQEDQPGFDPVEFRLAEALVVLVQRHEDLLNYTQALCCIAGKPVDLCDSEWIIRVMRLCPSGPPEGHSFPHLRQTLLRLPFRRKR